MGAWFSYWAGSSLVIIITNPTDLMGGREDAERVLASASAEPSTR